MQDVAVLFVQDAMRRENRRRGMRAPVFSLIAISGNLRDVGVARATILTNFASAKDLPLFAKSERLFVRQFCRECMFGFIKM